MARPNKTGLDYFPFDVDFFADEKIAAISGEFGIKGEITVIKLLCAVYRNGYFILWNEPLKYKLLRDLQGVSEELIDQIVNRLVKWGFFDENLFNSVKVLTSRGIQKRFFSITRRRGLPKDAKYMLAGNGCSGVIDNNNPAATELLTTKTIQRKEKKRKENISTSTTTARAREDVNDFPEFPQKDCAEKYPKPDAIEYIQIGELADWMKSHKQWLEAFCMNNHMAIDFVEKKIDEFVAHCENNGEMEKSTQDCLRHFNNWMRKEKNQVNNVKRSGKNQPPSHDDLDRAIAEGIARGRTRQEWEL